MLSICLLMHAYFSYFYDEIDYLYKQQIKMSKILTALVIAATLFVASSCSSENGEDPITPDNHQEQNKPTVKPYVTLSQTEATIPFDGGNLNVNMNYNVNFDVSVTYFANSYTHQEWKDNIAVPVKNVTAGTLSYSLNKNDGVGRIVKIDFTYKDSVLNSLYVRQMPNPSALKGKVIVGTSIFDSAGEGFGDVSVLECYLGKDNVDNWKNIKTLQVWGPLRQKDLDFLKKLVGSGDFTDRANMSGAHINLDLSNVKGMEKLPNKEFQGATALDSIALPEGLKEIGASAFDMCESLKHANVPWSVKVIGNYAFSNCTLTDLQTIKGNDLEDIGQYAFATNTILDSFGLPFDPKAFDRYSFILRAKKIYAPWNNDNADASLLPKIDFQKKTYESDTLVVPKGSLNLYKSSETFSKFKNIMEE